MTLQLLISVFRGGAAYLSILLIGASMITVLCLYLTFKILLRNSIT